MKLENKIVFQVGHNHDSRRGNDASCTGATMRPVGGGGDSAKTTKIGQKHFSPNYISLYKLRTTRFRKPANKKNSSQQVENVQFHRNGQQNISSNA